MTDSTRQAKALLRREAEGRRAEAAARGPEAGEQVRALFLSALRLPNSAVVSGYWPMRDEVDPRPLMTELAGLGHPLCLPVVEKRDAALGFRAWAPGDELLPAAFGTAVPPPSAEVRTPAVLLVPLLAFDARGFRLGYGGGFYDRTLADLRTRAAVLAVGLALSAQELPKIPTGRYDQRLDWVITETRAARFSDAA